jgi:hypothetical protein
VAQALLKWVNYTPSQVFRGVVLKKEVSELLPHKNLKYLSFTEDIDIATHFADPVNGFGQGIINIKEQLGEHGYIISYTPRLEEILFVHGFLDILPYGEWISEIGIDPKEEIFHLKKQKEIMIVQPEQPFTNIKKYVI